jgi:hypothetical protein
MVVSSICQTATVDAFPSQSMHSRLNDQSLSSQPSSSDPGDGRRRRRISIAPIESGPIESEAFPRRLHSEQMLVDKPTSDKEDWGLSKLPEGRVFPSTADEVVEGAFAAIAGTIHNCQTMNPHIVSNARSLSPLRDYRPVRQRSDNGRIGIELDGAQILFSENEDRAVTSEQATRRLSLMLAARLSTGSAWSDYENVEDGRDDNSHSEEPRDRPVAVYFNTVKQALMASQELRQLIHEELRARRSRGDTSGSTVYDMVSIQYLGDKIPKALQGFKKQKRRRNRGLAEGAINCEHGLIMVVQPTDFNAEYRPPGPALGAIGEFQKLAAQASILELPLITISPRFLSDETYLRGWDQSGYQRAGVYGGAEPPRGPMPWIMRDFSPPVFCWIGNALKFRARRPSPLQYTGCYLSGVSLVQSVMDQQHAWHMFAAKECPDDGNKVFQTSYEYLASTQSAHGRPTRDLLRKMIEHL